MPSQVLCRCARSQLLANRGGELRRRCRATKVAGAELALRNRVQARLLDAVSLLHQALQQEKSVSTQLTKG